MMINSKVVRLNYKNTQYLEEIRELFAKVKFYKDVYWDDNRIIRMALANLIWDFREYVDENKKNEVYEEMDKISEKTM